MCYKQDWWELKKQSGHKMDWHQDDDRQDTLLSKLGFHICESEHSCGPQILHDKLDLSLAL